MSLRLEVFEGATRTRVNLIRTYNYVSYTEELNGVGSFEIKIPTSETSLINLEVGNFILFEEDVLGIIKGIKDSEDSDTEITIYGYMVTHILEYRCFIKTEKIYGKPANMIETFFDRLYANPTDARRKISFLELAELPENLYMGSNVTWQATGKTFFEYLTSVLPSYGCGVRVAPHISNYVEGEANPNIDALLVEIIAGADRTIGGPDAFTPVVFSFDMNNVERYEYENNCKDSKTVAVVASEGEGQERKVIEIQNPRYEQEHTGYDRIELYVDARDLQSDNTEGEPLTDEELEELMAQRGYEAIEENDEFMSFDASVLQTNFKYGVDYFLGDWVTVISKDSSKKYNLQVNKVTKSISNGVEHLDIGFGTDWLEVQDKKQASAINKVSSGQSNSASSTERFSQLKDVSLYGTQNGQIPRYNASTNKWENSQETVRSLSVTAKTSSGVNIADVNINGNVTRLYAPESGSDVSVTPKLNQGTNIADIEVDGVINHIYAPSGSAGSSVTITPTLVTGTKVADYSIDGVPGVIYVPSSTSDLPFTVTVLDNGKVRLTYDD